MLLVRWFLSKRIRQAVDICRHIRKTLHAQRDQLSAEAIAAVQEKLDAARALLRQGGGAGEDLEKALNDLDSAVQASLIPYPNPGWRDNIETFLVTGAVVLALRTFFFQPMAIPSGSAQPTLYGITHEDLRDRPDVAIPGLVDRFVQKWWSGISYYHIVAKSEGTLNRITPPRLVFPFVKSQMFEIGRERYRVYFPSSFDDMSKWGQLKLGMRFQAGDDVMRLKMVAGDHLFVNRVIYNFRPPHRGEIIVFTSTGVPSLIQNTHYIKRLVAVGGESVRIGDDRHLVINGRRLTGMDPGFENIYSFDPDKPPRDSEFSGHVNGTVGARFTRAQLAPLFPNEEATFVVRKNHLLVMGDNTMNSYDGRAWGDFPQEKLVGRASFVFWPITSRFGWGYR